MLSDLISSVILPLLGLSALLCGWRALRGPTLADRAVGVELFATIGIGFAACLAVTTDQAVLLDLGVVLALVAFLGALALARVMEKST